MKKIFFSLILSVLLLNSSSYVFAMGNYDGVKGDKEMFSTDPRRLRCSSRFFRYDTSWIFAPLKEEHFRVNSEEETDETARGQREMWIDDTEILPILEEMRAAGWKITPPEQVNPIILGPIFEEVDSKKIEEASNNKKIEEAFALGRENGHTEGRAERENEMSFCQRHPKKLVAGAVLLTVVGVKAVDYWFASRE